MGSSGSTQEPERRKEDRDEEQTIDGFRNEQAEMAAGMQKLLQGFTVALPRTDWVCADEQPNTFPLRHRRL
jgi:hypothetical protein